METGAAATINPTVSYYADQQQSKRKNPPVKLVGQEPKNAPPSTLPPPTSSLPSPPPPRIWDVINKAPRTEKPATQLSTGQFSLIEPP